MFAEGQLLSRKFYEDGIGGVSCRFVDRLRSKRENYPQVCTKQLEEALANYKQSVLKDPTLTTFETLNS